MMFRNNFINGTIFIREYLNSISNSNNTTRLAIYKDNITALYFKSRNNPKCSIHIKSKTITISEFMLFNIISLIASRSANGNFTIHTHLTSTSRNRLKHPAKHITETKIHSLILLIINFFIKIF